MAHINKFTNVDGTITSTADLKLQIEQAETISNLVVRIFNFFNRPAAPHNGNDLFNHGHRAA